MKYERGEEMLIMDPVPLRREGESYEAALARLARELLRRTLARHNDDHQAAAEDLVMPGAEFERELERLGIGPR